MFIMHPNPQIPKWSKNIKEIFSVIVFPHWRNVHSSLCADIIPKFVTAPPDPPNLVVTPKYLL